MLQQGHVRLMIAMLLAVALHALVFVVFVSQPKLKLSANSAAMQVSFLSTEAKPGADKTKPLRVAEQSVSKVESQAVKPPIPQQAVDVIATPTVQDHVQVNQTATREKATDMGEATTTSVEPAHVSDDVARNADMGVVPEGVQQQLLVNLTYPKLARRHGWQGRAEFELRIYKQSVDKLTLLASTGFPVLDHAAERGLALVRDIPLSNGLYHMPVVFELR